LTLGLWYLKGDNSKLAGYIDVDYVGYKLDRKSTSGSYQLLGQLLISWNSKEQNSLAMSTIEAKYIAIGAYCAQLLWIS